MEHEDNHELYSHWQKITRISEPSYYDDNPMKIPTRFLPGSNGSYKKNYTRKDNDNNETVELQTISNDEEQCWQCSRTTKV